MTRPYLHEPVLLLPAVAALAVRPGACYIDGTLGGGGHALAIASACRPGLVLGFDLDPAAIAAAQDRAASAGIDNLIAINDSYVHWKKYWLETRGPGELVLGGMLLDLGLSSYQLADPDRGFAFKLDGPLDMAFGPGAAGAGTASLVNSLPEVELADLIYRLGEERMSRQIAAAIVRTRRRQTIKTVSELVEAIAAGLPASARHGRRHFATRTFQALRIATNDELTALEDLLRSVDAVAREFPPGARLAVITYHSLEDRIVKQFFRQGAKAAEPGARWELVTKKPITPSADEIRANPRSRSAKLRVAIKK